MSGDTSAPISAIPAGDQGSDQVSSSNEGLLDRDEEIADVKVKVEPEAEEAAGR